MTPDPIAEVLATPTSPRRCVRRSTCPRGSRTAPPRVQVRVRPFQALRRAHTASCTATVG